MKHINLSEPNEAGISLYMVTQEGNSFGDQLLSLKKLTNGGPITAYETIAITSRGEGDWMDVKQMKQWMKEVTKWNK